MSALVLCNIGNSDLKVNNERIKRPRPEGEQLWQTFEEHTFQLPIIEPCLRYLLNEGVVIEQLRMFYTDQPATATTRAQDRQGISLRDKDTLWYAQIAERVIHERFGSEIKAIGRIRVERGNGQMINPSLHDEAFDAYGDLIERLYRTDTTACYVMMAGGIPACNVALQLRTLSAYGDRCRFIYQPEGGTPYELRVGMQMQATFHRATAIDALQRRDFATALQQVTTLERINPAILALLRYAHYREAFDFSRARSALNEGLRAATGELRTFLQALKPELEQLIDRADSAALLLEVYASAKISFNNGRYADFLGRVFRFQEAMLRHILETCMGIPTDMSRTSKAVNLPKYRALIEENPNLKAALDSAQIDGAPLRYLDGPNRPVMLKMLDYLTSGGKRSDGTPYLSRKEQGNFQGLKHHMGQLDTLSDLRNQSIIAHGFAGVSREELDNVSSGNAQHILGYMESIVQILGIDARNVSFDQIADRIVEELRRSGS